MSQSLAVGDPVARPAAAHERVATLDPRRALQLALGALWLLDGMLQFQPAMFGRGFPQMLAGGAQGNPAVVARPITWSAGLIGHHVVDGGPGGAARQEGTAVALLMALFMVAYVVRVADRLPLRTPALAMAPAPDPPVTPAPAGHALATARPYLAPRCGGLCKMAMGLTMAYMLVLML